MKRFIMMILCVSTFFIGLGGLIERAGANFKSDERAVEIIKLARIAIGGDANINNVKSMTIIAKATQNLNIDEVQNSKQGDMEINMQFPNQFSKMMKFGAENGAGGSNIQKDVNVIVMNKSGGDNTLNSSGGEKKVMVFKTEGDKTIVSDDNSDVSKGNAIIASKEDAAKVVWNANTENGIIRKIIVDKNAGISGVSVHQNDFFRTAFALLLTAPEGVDVNYAYAGSGNVDGFSCDIIEAQTGGSSYKLFLDQSTHLPRMMSYQATKPFVIKLDKAEIGNIGEKDNKIFVRQADISPTETTEFQIKFSDYRNASGVQLPYKWTQTAGGQPDQNVDVMNYEINPANIAEKFQTKNILMRVKKSQ